MNQMQQQPMMPVDNVYEEYISKHFCFPLDTEKQQDAIKAVGEWLTDRALECFDLTYKYANIENGELHVYVACKRVKERKFPPPPGVYNVKLAPKPRT